MSVKWGICISVVNSHEKESLHQIVSHVHNDHSADALKFLHFINTHNNQTMRKQIFLLFGGKQTEIMLLEHAIVHYINYNNGWN